MGEIRALLEDPGVAKMIENQSAEQLLAEMDCDGKGYATFEDFRRTMNGEGAPQAVFPQGAECEYLQGTKWIITTVTEVNMRSGALQVEAKPDYWMSCMDQQSKLRPVNAVEQTPWDVGSFVYYKSVSQKQWVPAQIIEKSVDGTVQINLKPGLWFNEELKNSHLKTENNFKADTARALAKNAMA